MRLPITFTAAVVAVGLCLIGAGVAQATVSNVYWRVDLNQSTSVIAYGIGPTEADAWTDCYRLQAITRAMTAAETRKAAVAAITTSAVRWCKNPMRYATVSPDQGIPPGTATLKWTAPTQNTDGTSLTNLAGYRIHYGASPDALTYALQVANPGLSSYTLSNLAPGTYFFAVRAYTSDGTESKPSNVLSKVIQ
jgi:fibronectin type III domain protein